MKKYIEFRIMKRTVLIISIIIAMIGVGCGYYIWCANHPNITIKISEGRAGEHLKVETPYIAISGKGIAEPTASIELKLNNIVMQHEFMCNYIKDTYKESDIKLDLTLKDHQTILNYSGTATTLDDIVVDFEKEINCEFALDANVFH